MARIAEVTEKTRKNFCWGRGRTMERVKREREAGKSC